MNKIVLIDEKKCTGCGVCVDNCPHKILYLDDGKCKVTDEQNVKSLVVVKFYVPLGQLGYIKIGNK